MRQCTYRCVYRRQPSQVQHFLCSHSHRCTVIVPVYIPRVKPKSIAGLKFIKRTRSCIRQHIMRLKFRRHENTGGLLSSINSSTLLISRLFYCHKRQSSSNSNRTTTLQATRASNSSFYLHVKTNVASMRRLQPRLYAKIKLSV